MYKTLFIIGWVLSLIIAILYTYENYETLDVIKKFHNLGSHIVFLSTDLVFDNENNSSKNYSKKNPLTQYGKQKLTIENELLKLKKNITIIRMSKVISIFYDLFKNWMTNIKYNRYIEAYSNYYLSPISLKYVINNIANNKLNGIVHLTGEKRISYFEFAEILFNKKKRSKFLIRGKKFKDKNTPNYLNNLNKNMLDMSETKKRFFIKPQKISSVIIDLYKEYESSKL